MSQKPNELPVPIDALSDSTSHEVMRVWTGDTEYVSLTGQMFVDPGTWGFLFCQLARHIGRAYELNGFASRESVLIAIREQFFQTWAEMDDDSSGKLLDK